MKNFDVIIIGGGIAGLSVAHHLGRAGVRQVCLLEREELFASHSSGRNAAMFRHLDQSIGVLALAKKSRDYLNSLLPDWLDRTGAIFVADKIEFLNPLLELARQNQIAHQIIGKEENELTRLLPSLEGTAARFGLIVHDDGIIDIHAVCTSLAISARQAGLTLRLNSAVKSIKTINGRVNGVALENGENLFTPIVVNGAGAWARMIGATIGTDIPIVPMRRHIASLEPKIEINQKHPIVWCVDANEVYFRPESGGVLTSPCDEDIFEPCLPPQSEHARELLAIKLSKMAPKLADAGLRRSWACLRSFAPDRELVIGEDPRIKGLFWIAGLGGHGMTAGVATGEVVARQIQGIKTELDDLLSPSRLIN